MRKTKKILIGLVILLFVLLIFLFNNYIIVFKKSNCKNVKIGVIDGKYSQVYKNVVYGSKASSSIKTHGDSVLEFVNDFCENIIVYYYDASDENNKIDSESILKGLDWMAENNITNINFSLSSKIYYPELAKYFYENKDGLNIYASYSNVINTKDYPAQYDKVVGIGVDDRIKYKAEDVKYRTSKIIILDSAIKRYNGNSYLSVYTLISKMIQK